MDIFRFRDFPVYKLTRKFRKEVKEYFKSRFPKSDEFRLKDQLWRALNSIVLNIAEGSDHYSGIEFSKFLNVALRSLNEVVACLECAYDDGFITSVKLDYFTSKASEIAKQLKAFSSKVRVKKFS